MKLKITDVTTFSLLQESINERPSADGVCTRCIAVTPLPGGEGSTSERGEQVSLFSSRTLG